MPELNTTMASIISGTQDPSPRSLRKAERILEILMADDGAIGLLIERSICTPMCLKKLTSGRGVVSWHPCGTCVDCRIRKFIDDHGLADLARERLDDLPARLVAAK